MKFPNIFNRRAAEGATPPTGTVDPQANAAMLMLARAMMQKASAIQSLQQQTQQLTKKDIGAWRQAWQMAINYEEPRRASLYDVYTDALIDNHLQGCIVQRKGHTLQKKFVIRGRDGKEDEKAKRYFENEWFVQFIDLALDAVWWGHSLIQFGEIVRGDVPRFTCCELVPRKHVIPEYGVLTPEVGGDIRTGIPYREGELADWCVEFGSPRSLGLLLNVAPQCISKKNMLAYWDMFGEIFGMPLRIGYTPSQNTKEWCTISSMLSKMGAAGWALLPTGTEIEIKETSRGDAYNVYDKRIDRANSEISKANLGQTMTIDNGSSLSQSETHLEVFNNICRGDATLLQYGINNRLIPLMIKHGFRLEGCVFEWDDAASYTPEQQRENERLILQYFDVNPDYFRDKYKIDITGVRASDADGFFQ